MNEPVAWRTHYPSGWEYKDGNPPFELKGNSQLLYTHPVKELHLSLQKTEDGELVAVTYTDDEHRIVEVLWQKPPVKELTDEEIADIAVKTDIFDPKWVYLFARAILRKAQEK